METIPPDHRILHAFKRGREEGAKQHKYGRRNPYGENKPYERDAWFAGYDEEFDPSPVLRASMIELGLLPGRKETRT